MSEHHVTPADVETLAFDWGTLKWPCTPDTTDSEAFSMGIVQLHPGEGHERHTHPDSEEVLYVSSGEGTQTVADEEFEIAPDDTHPGGRRTQHDEHRLGATAARRRLRPARSGGGTAKPPRLHGPAAGGTAGLTGTRPFSIRRCHSFSVS